MGTFVFFVYGIIFTVLSIRHVSYVLVALGCMFAYEQWGSIHIPYIAENGTLVNLCILFLAAVAWFRVPTGSTFEFMVYPSRVLLILLLLYAFASTMWAPVDANSTARFLDNVHYMFISILIAPLLVITAQDFTRYLDCLTWVGGVLVVLFAFVPSFEGRGLVYEYNLEETLALPLALGDFAGLVMLVTMLRLRTGLLKIVWALVVFGSAMFLIVKTGSRGQLIFSLATLLICLPARWKAFSINKFLLYLLLGALAVAAGAVVAVTENTLSARIDASDEATMGRVMMIRILLEAWSSDPMAVVFGLGSSASWSRDLVQFYPHNIPFEILGELGLVGFIVFSWVVISLFLKAFSGKAKAALKDQSLIDFSAMFAAFVFALLISCKQGTLLLASDLFMYIVLAEKCFVLGQLSGSKSPRRKRRIIGFKPARQAA